MYYLPTHITSLVIVLDYVAYSQCSNLYKKETRDSYRKFLSYKD